MKEKHCYQVTIPRLESPYANLSTCLHYITQKELSETLKTTSSKINGWTVGRKIKSEYYYPLYKAAVKLFYMNLR